MWVLLALLSPALSAVVVVIDKVVVDRYSPGAFMYAFGVGICEIVIVAVMAPIVISVQGLDLESLAGGMVTGAVAATGLVFFLAGLRLGQAARVAPLHALNPLIVAPAAAIFLGERLSAAAAVAIVLAVFGAIMVSYQRGAGSRTFGNPVAIVLTLISASFLALTFILTKHFIEDSGFWQFYVYFRFGFAIILLATFVMPEVHGSLLVMARNRGFVGLVFLNIIVIVSVSFGVRIAAVNLGPVSLVSAIGSAQPAMVFIYSLWLAKVSPSNFGDWITRRTLRPQVAGIGAIVAAVAIISAVQ